jgi:hypothetical protein
MSASVTSPTATTTSAPVSSSSSVISLDIAQVTNTSTQTIVGRQVTALGDSVDYNQTARLIRRPATGSEPGLVTNLAPNNPDLMTITEVLFMVLLELKSLNQNLNGVTADNIPS